MNILRGSCPERIGPYVLGDSIGMGTSCIVVKATNSETQKTYAIKIVSKRYFHNNQQVIHFQSEVQNMMSLCHPNIVTLYDLLEDSVNYYMIQEYCGNGDLSSYISKNQPLPLAQALQLFHQILSAVAFLHSNNIAHRDIKAENVLLDEMLTPKLGDFGFSLHVRSNEIRRTICGTFYYIAPEILQGSPYNPILADIWSCGVLLHVFVTAQLPWSCENPKLAKEEILKGQLSILPDVPKDVQEVILLMCDFNPQNRMPIDTVLALPLLKRVQSTKHVHKGFFRNKAAFTLNKYNDLLSSAPLPLDEKDHDEITDMLKECNRKIKKKANQLQSNAILTIISKGSSRIKVRSRADSPFMGPLFVPGWEKM
ncbi:CAMK family protein kinase [Trichomonas vaginalis G3]|uniref:CAMK family protein kinase n=1 Tax=Trichomonas vaginalis (strain ATCC PRA-98 / G3) TaxID=412133 RepID=A2FUL1_TRIV3|nr:protein serine/threonine kinase protein [Trichomonas vaginalis G3]EAX91418.1 CAMK family protein kinase [Trichomonas vaginalis G3]KAI5540975.1 protein serine/threonine kinase protein [Trichomonas vaginalis G3]|eukprot:XP_001304348.1 CAMK family protein kinase [Trichomonas vaginalis G3]